MNLIKSYKDLELEIEILEDRLETFEIQKKALQKMCSMGGPGEVTGINYAALRVNGGNTKLDYGEYLEQVKEIDNHIYLHRETVESLNNKRHKILDRLKALDGLEYKVVYLRDLKGMQLQEIADELGYSLSKVKKVSMNNTRMYKI